MVSRLVLTSPASLQSRHLKQAGAQEEAQALLGLNRDLIEALGQRDGDRAADLAVRHAEQRRSMITRAVPVDERRPASSQAAE